MRINGNFFEVSKEICLYDLLIKENFDILRVAVELNGKIVPKSKYLETFIVDKDSLEVVSFVGGG